MKKWLLGLCLVWPVWAEECDRVEEVPSEKVDLEKPEEKVDLEKPEKKKLLKKIQDYLNSVRTLKSRFTQTSPKSGMIHQGSITMRRGGNIRIQYDLPYGLIIVGKGGELRYYDKKMDKVNSTSTESTPLGTLLSDTVEFKKDVRVLDVRQQFGVIRLLVTKDGLGNGGYLILTFSENPIVLRQWSVIDNDKNTLHFSLIDPVFNPSVEDRFFDLSSVKARF